MLIPHTLPIEAANIHRQLLESTHSKDGDLLMFLETGKVRPSLP